MLQLDFVRNFFGSIYMLETFDTYLVGKALSTDKDGIVWIPIEDVRRFITSYFLKNSK